MNPIWSRDVDTDLLTVCAILHYVDADLLRRLTGTTERQVRAFMRQTSLVPLERADGAYILEADVREEVRAQLRAERPDEELVLHIRSFHAFAERMNTIAGRRRRDEDACFYHLEQLFYLLYQRDAWQTIAEHVAVARQAEPQQERYRHRLTMYEGYILLNTEQYDSAHATLTSLLGADDTDTYTQLRTFNGLALVHMYQTQFEPALTWLRRLYQLACDVDDTPYQGVALVNMGMIYTEIAYHERAYDVMQQSLDLFRELEDVPRQVYSLYEMGQTALSLGHWNRSKQHLREAAELADAFDLTARLKNIYWGQGLLYHFLGDVDRSETAYRRALDIAQAPDTHNPRVASETWWYLGFLYHTQERWDDALSAYDQAYTLAAELDRPHRKSLIQYQRGTVYTRLGRRADARVTFEQAVSAIENLRGDATEEEIKIGLIGVTQQLYEAMVLLHTEEDRDADAFNYVERARSRAFLDMLVDKAPELYDKVDQPVAKLTDVQAALPDDALLLEYYTTGVVPPGDNIINNLPPDNERLRAYLVQPARLFCFVITSDQFHVHEVSIDPNLLQPKSVHVSPTRRLLRPRQLAHLHETLIAPLEPLLRDKDMLYIIPHGPLHYVPWMALRSPAGTYLLDQNGPAIALAPSATILLRNCLGREPSHEGDFLALGYNDDGDDELQYAETEAAFVAHLMGGEAWTGEQPKSQRLSRRADSLRWLHVSGHGVFHPHAPLDSELRLGKDDAPRARDIMNSLELSADLVTLSACTSGLNQIVPGDELLGLPRAFLYAGAPTVICTPWEAADLVALLVMERFYRELRADVPPAHALRNAQVAVRTMTGRELLATLARWRREYPDDFASLTLPTLSPEQLDRSIFADPSHWALFTLIGRPY